MKKLVKLLNKIIKLILGEPKSVLGYQGTTWTYMELRLALDYYDTLVSLKLL